MEGEIDYFTIIWLSIILSQCYCYAIGKIVSKGFKRLVFYLPIFCLFIVCPIKLSSTILCSATFVFITMLGSLKLLAFAFGKGPLALNPKSSLSEFLLVFCLPIEITKNPSAQKYPKYFIVKILGFAFLCPLFEYYENYHLLVYSTFFGLLIYLCLEIFLVATSVVTRVVWELELEPHFDEPYLSTSLHEFWGKRWNLVVTHTLRSAIYEPGVYLWAKVLGRKWASIPAVLGTFVVSGFFHELIYFCFGCTPHTLGAMWFFILHGLCLAVKIWAKKTWIGTWKIPTPISVPLTIGFMIWSSSWLFFPQFRRCGVDSKGLQEILFLGRALKDRVTNPL